MQEQDGPAPEPMDNVTKALGLAKLGIKVFPVLRSTRVPAIPGEGGVYHATIDAEQIATWFLSEYVGDKYAVGYWTGGSDLLVVDPDRGKKNGHDGFKSMAEKGLDVGSTHSYPTPSGGEHHVFSTDRTDLSPGQNVLHQGERLMGVDIRAAGSYAVWWADEVPEDRSVFSTDIPQWVIDAATTDAATFTGEGYNGSVKDWLDYIPDDELPSGRVRDLVERIPKSDFGHAEMVDLVWNIVRMGSERETGIRFALDRLRKEWLRGEFDTPKFRKDFYAALVGAINKGGRLQKPVPVATPLERALDRATEMGARNGLNAIEREVSETTDPSEVDYAKARKEMFRQAATAGLSAGDALGVVMGSKAFKNSKVSMESAWYSDGEPEYHDAAEESEPAAAEEVAPVEPEVEIIELLARLNADSQAFSLTTDAEKKLLETKPYEWWGDEYLEWVKGRLRHFNRPYHVATMWAALSVITTPWGKVPLSSADPMDVNLYLNADGASSTGKSESLGFGTGLIDAYYGLEHSPIIGDISKLSALALHRALILRDGEPSMVFGDEVQSFFQGVQNSQWQNGILGDISSHYGGKVSPKLTLNDKEISGKRARTMLTVYLTGIADQLLEAIDLSHWTSGFFYRYLWSFGNPRTTGDYSINMMTVGSSYTAQFETWAREFKRLGALQEVRWGAGRLVEWEPDAVKRMEEMKRQIDVATQTSPLYDAVFVNANGRFADSMMKVATIIALAEAAEKVTLRHVVIALSYAGPWHRSMVLAVEETAKDPFDRECERALNWMKRNAVRKVGEKQAFIQRAAVMRAFKPNEVADRLLRQLTEEGWITKAGDLYQIEN